ncbi:MAG: hypothetical protein ACOX3G_10390 [Armatimonadota bacterium]
MRPGSHWKGEAANPFVAALVGALVALVVGYLLSYLFSLIGLGVLTGDTAWNFKDTLPLAGLNYYAAQHVTIFGSGPAINGNSVAWISLPITLWGIIPAVALMIGGFVAGRMRDAAGRWGMIGSAVGAGILHTAALAAASSFVFAEFVSTAVPPVQGFELSPPDLAYRSSIIGVLIYASIFGVIFSYLGGLGAVRSGERTDAAPGKWWVCAKAVLAVGLVIQLLIVAGVWVWFVKSDIGDEDLSVQPKLIQVLPAVAGAGYSFVYSARLYSAAVPVNIPSAAYKMNLQVYRGTTVTQGTETTKKPPIKYAWVVGLIAAVASMAAGWLAVRMGSRDGSLPTAFRITILQFIYLAVIMLMCGMGWGIVGQSSVNVSPVFDSAMWVTAGGVLIFSLAGAYWTNRRFAGRLSGFPPV